MPKPPVQPSASLEEERREILKSVMGVLAGNSPDPDEMAACSYLLKHLTQDRRAPGPQRV
jgi:plasmid stability protein